MDCGLLPFPGKEGTIMEIKAMEDLLLQELMELYAAEQQIVKALPKMAKSAHDSKLRGAFTLHQNRLRITLSAWTKSSKCWAAMRKPATVTLCRKSSNREMP